VRGAPLEPTRRYVNHHLDSTRWEVYTPRDDDVVVTTSYKSGTTWMQQIVHLLFFKGDPEAPPLPLASPWVDARFHGPREELAAQLEAQTHRRFLKSHLPLDGLPIHPQVRYVVVARDARDVFMSLWNHWSSYTENVLARLEDGNPGPAFPACHGDIHRAWREWITRGWFEWESEGWPFWSNLHHIQSYWEERRRDNLLLVHYADLLADPSGQIQRVADFLDVALTPQQLELAVRDSSFDRMKSRMKEQADTPLREFFRGGVDAFVYKGTNGRWREVLGPEELALHAAAVDRVLTPDCAAWLEGGWLGLESGREARTS